MINDFSIKACKKKLEDLGYKNLEYYSYGSAKEENLVFYFKFDFGGLSFYFAYHDSFGVPVDAFMILNNHVKHYVNYCTEELFLPDDVKIFMRDQAMSKVCFDNKVSYSFPTNLLDKFCDKSFNKYPKPKDFMQNIEEFNLMDLLQPIENKRQEVNA